MLFHLVFFFFFFLVLFIPNGINRSRALASMVGESGGVPGSSLIDNERHVQLFLTVYSRRLSDLFLCVILS